MVWPPLYMVLPVLTLAAQPMAFIARLTRSGLLDVYQHEYIRTARAKGLGSWTILTRHAQAKQSQTPQYQHRQQKQPVTAASRDGTVPSESYDIFWSLVILIIVAVFFYKFFLPKFQAVFDERAAKIEGGIAKVEQAQKDADEAKAKYGGPAEHRPRRGFQDP